MISTTQIAVVGGGPAGAVIAFRLAQLGHEVVLIARMSSARSHCLETLTPGVAEQLAFLHLGDALDGALLRQTTELELRWGSNRFEQNTSVKPRILIERSAFNNGLITAVKRRGVNVLPADVEGAERSADGWRLKCGSPDGPLILIASSLIDATGRRGLLPTKRLRNHRLLGVRGQWSGTRLPNCTRIAASEQCWAWGAPLADHTYEAILFLDPRDLNADRKSLEQRYRSLVCTCGLLDGVRVANCIGPLRACDATPYVEVDAVGQDFLKIGDACLAIDPLSSAGVQMAIQSGISGAVAVHTLRRNSAATGLITAFWSSELARRSTRHAKWSAEYYRSAAERFPTPFWQSRAASWSNNPPLAYPPNQETLPKPNQALQLSGSLSIVDAPCVVGDIIELRQTVVHPSLSESVAFLDGADLPILLARVFPGVTAAGVLQLWSCDVDPRRGLAILSWMWRRRLIEPLPTDACDEAEW
jgi:flavin-dependent dehydrogenase